MADARLRSTVLGFASAALTLAGCTPAGPPTYDFRGKVLYKGQPIELKAMGESKAGGGAQVWLVAQDGAEKQKKQAIVTQDGTFAFAEGNKPTAGRYKIVVEWRDNYPMGPDKLKGKFDEKSSTTFCTIPDDKEITVDVFK
jgi:hypothetical protein